MFTGIAEETGKIQTISENGIEIECAKVLEDAKLVTALLLTVSVLLLYKIPETLLKLICRRKHFV